MLCMSLSQIQNLPQFQFEPHAGRCVAFQSPHTQHPRKTSYPEGPAVRPAAEPRLSRPCCSTRFINSAVFEVLTGYAPCSAPRLLKCKRPAMGLAAWCMRHRNPDSSQLRVRARINQTAGTLFDVKHDEILGVERPAPALHWMSCYSIGRGCGPRPPTRQSCEVYMAHAPSVAGVSEH